MCTDQSEASIHLEEHDVLGEGAGLVAEQDLDLAELLVEVRGVALGRLVRLGVVQIPVPLQEHRTCK